LTEEAKGMSQPALPRAKGSHWDDQVEIFLFPSREVREVLADNETDVAELLERNGVRVVQRVVPDPRPVRGASYREPVTVLLASAALVAALTPILARAIESLSRKRVVVYEEATEPVVDANGNPIRDANGQILERRTRKPLLLESGSTKETTSLSIKGPLQIAIEFETSPKD
jgi:hypothetical protein